jgi:hypothetical protein
LVAAKWAWPKRSDLGVAKSSVSTVLPTLHSAILCRYQVWWDASSTCSSDSVKWRITGPARAFMRSTTRTAKK